MRDMERHQWDEKLTDDITAAMPSEAEVAFGEFDVTVDAIREAVYAWLKRHEERRLEGEPTSCLVCGAELTRSAWETEDDVLVAGSWACTADHGHFVRMERGGRPLPERVYQPHITAQWR